MLSDEDLECLVCNEDFTSVVGAATSPRLLVKCGHSLCLECSSKVTCCPLCRLDVQQPQGHVRHFFLERIIAAITQGSSPNGARDYSTIVSDLIERQLKEGARVAMAAKHRKLLAEEAIRRQGQQEALLAEEHRQRANRLASMLAEEQLTFRFQQLMEQAEAVESRYQQRDHRAYQEDRGNTYVCQGVHSDFLRRAPGAQQFRTVDMFSFTPEGYFMIRDNGTSVIIGECLSLQQTVDTSLITYLTYSNERFYCEDRTSASFWNFHDEGFHSAVISMDRDAVRVALGEGGGWIVVLDDDSVQMGGQLPRTLYNKIRSRNPRTHVLQEVSLGPDGQWFIKWESGRTDWCLQGPVSEAAAELENEGRQVQNIHFGENDAYLIRCTE